MTPDPGIQSGDPLPPTAETLVGAVDARSNANVAWVHTLPGEMAAPPQVLRGPDDELIVMLTAERRPLGKKRFVDDVLLLRLDADTGALRWLKVVDPGARPALDTHGDIILAWKTKLQKLDGDGESLWERSREPKNGYELVNVAVDSNDELLLAWLELSESPGKIDGDPVGYVEVEKRDANGERLWSSQFGDGTSYLETVWITVDPQDNPVILAAGLQGPFDFGGGPLKAEDVVAKYDAAGKHVFSMPFGGYGPVAYRGNSPVQTDRDGNIVLTSESVGDIDIGLGAFSCGLQYVVKLDPTGEPLWNICTAAGELTLMPDGGFVTSSTLRQDVKLGMQPCARHDSGSEDSEVALARFDADGNWLATQCAADPGYQSAGAAASDASGMFFMTAAFTGQLSLPDGSAAAALDQNYTALIAKVALAAP